MPMDTLARNLAAEITGRIRWADGRGPAGMSDRDHLDLLANLLFRPNEMLKEELIPIRNSSLKARLGLEPDARYFTPMELMLSDSLYVMSNALQTKMLQEPAYRPSADERAMMDIQQRLIAVSYFVDNKGLAIVLTEDPNTIVGVGILSSDQSAAQIQRAIFSLQDAYLNHGDMRAAAQTLLAAIALDAPHSKVPWPNTRLELFYNTHQPWKLAALATALAMLFCGTRRFMRSKFGSTLITVLLVLSIAWAGGELILGLWLRTMILGRVPVSNTYEVLLWMSAVALAIGIIAQIGSPKSGMLLAGLVASLLANLFAMLVPFDSRTNPLPAVLRTDYWLVFHVLTIVAGYGVLLLTAIMAHVYLIKHALLRRPCEVGDRSIVRMYRVMQIGVFLLTGGTVLGGVWAAESWGRFWGWDPKETWSLISIILYFTLLHAWHAGWIRSIGFAISTIVGFIAIVWTFYGVNYVLASGLHSYGFGTGGGLWLAVWLIAEIVFIQVCLLCAPRTLAGSARGSRCA